MLKFDCSNSVGNPGKPPRKIIARAKLELPTTF
jgi:hypothetical protein